MLLRAKAISRKCNFGSCRPPLLMCGRQYSTSFFEGENTSVKDSVVDQALVQVNSIKPSYINFYDSKAFGRDYQFMEGVPESYLTPTNEAIQYLTNFHDFSHLPWWLTIMVVSTSLRFLYLPMHCIMYQNQQ